MLIPRWNITPVCGSTTLRHVEEAFAVEAVEIEEGDEDVRKLKGLMLGVE